MKILGVRIDEIDIITALKKASNFLNSSQQYTIFTPNPEMLVDAQKDEKFKKILNSADINLCDGRGLELISHKKLTRIAGVDFMLKLCELAASMNKNVFLLGSADNAVIEQTAAQLKKIYPTLKISGRDKGHALELINGRLLTDENKNDLIIEKITKSKPDILLVAFGHIKQEKWINENLHKIPSVKIAIGIGGAFDYISGHIKRAPEWMRHIGLEWLYRLFKQPKRIGRIYKATVLFFYLYLTKKNA